MITELLAALIVTGAILVFVGRYYAHRKAKPEQDRKELAASTDKLKEELTRSADAVIARMGGHVEQLEGMLREADAKNAVFEALLREADESRKVLEVCLKEAQETAQQLKGFQSAAAAQRAPLHHVEPPPPVSGPAATYEREEQADTPKPLAEERQDVMEFAAVLQNSIARDAMEEQEFPVAPAQIAQEEASPVAEVPPAPRQAPAEAPPDPAPREATAADKARALLLSGVPVEEVSRQTGMGKGAVELVKELSRRQLAHID